MQFGYARVSTAGQCLDRQIDALIRAGVDKRLIYQEKYTGARKKRPELDKLMEKLESGDILIVTGFSRLTRSRKHIYEMIDFFQEKNIILKSLSENIDLSTPTGKLIFGNLALLVQWQREISLEDIKEGFAAGKARGKIYGRPFKLNSYVVNSIREEIKTGKPIKEIARELNVTPPTIYNYLKRGAS